MLFSDSRVFRCLLGSILLGASLAAPAEEMRYPAAARESTEDRLFGQVLPAPYRWMESLQDPQLKTWVDAENALTARVLDGDPLHARFEKRLAELWRYPELGVPTRAGTRLFYTRKEGDQQQAVVYARERLDGPERVVLDPNLISPDGAQALSLWQPSPDGRYLGYALSPGGSDWQVFHVRDLRSGKDLDDEVRWAKFSALAWTHDGKGFFYTRFPAPPAGSELSAPVRNAALWYHRVGSPQARDRKVFALPTQPDYFPGASTSEDGRYLWIQASQGSNGNLLWFARLPSDPGTLTTREVHPLFEHDDKEYLPIGNLGHILYVQTNQGAERRRVVALDLDARAPRKLVTVVAEGPATIEDSTMAGGHVVVHALVDAHSVLTVYDVHAHPGRAVTLPDIGQVEQLSARNDRDELFFGFETMLAPRSIWRLRIADATPVLLAKPEIPFDPSAYETRQVFYTSRDGTRIPMSITARRDLPLDGGHPLLMYGYGGFKISILPHFSPSTAAWLEQGGVYAVPNLRGGDEYGESWHQAGMLERKQNVFDDFAAAGDFLVQAGYTSRKRLAISGASNGGLLVGASITQHPGDFAAAWAAVGVHDMLRFHKFSGGSWWVDEYGSPDEEKAFHWLAAYSPLHNVQEGRCYPATFLTTADHDDRVVPSHTYQFAAALQHAQSCEQPILLEVATNTSHGYMPTSKRVAEMADVLSFLGRHTGMGPDAQRPSGSGGSPPSW